MSVGGRVETELGTTRVRSPTANATAARLGLRWALVVSTLALLALATAVWSMLHSARLTRDADLAAVCTDARRVGRPDAELAAEYATLGVVGRESCSPCPGRRAYTTLVTPRQSFSCEVELDAHGAVRTARVFRMTYAEATPLPELPVWVPDWTHGAWIVAQRPLSVVGAALTP